MAPPRLHLRTLLALGVLVCLGAQAWPRQIDDQFITLAFAHNWAETGNIQWGTGEVVEACSSFLQLSLATVAVLVGLDANVFVKVLAALASALIVLFASTRLPRGAAGILVLAAIVTWEPLGWWSFAGMETTLYALLLCVGWAGVLGGSAPALGLGALWLSATAHPEGNAHFLIAAALLLVRPGHRRAALALLAALALAHAARVAYFGAWWSTPYLVKIASTDPWGPQWGRVGLDLVCAGGILAVVAALFPLRPIVLVPLALQVAVALRAEPDWMGHARQLLPGVLATALAWSTGMPRALSRRALAVLAVIVAGFALVDSPTVDRDRIGLRDLTPALTPLRWLGSTLDTPQGEDVDWIVTHAPVGSAVMIEDVGMPGNVADVRIYDLVGLTDRTMALAMLGDDGANAALRDRFAADPPALVRRMRYAGEGIPRSIPWLRLPQPVSDVWPQGTALLYTLDPHAPTVEEVVARWAALHARYPSQGPVAWRYALAEAARGRLAAATAIAADMSAHFPADPLMAALPEAIFAAFPEGVYEAPDTLRQFSREIPKEEASQLALAIQVEPDAGQTVDVRWDCSASTTTVTLDELTHVPLPAWVCPGTSARLRVEARDERPNKPLPRAMYVGIEGR